MSTTPKFAEAMRRIAKGLDLLTLEDLCQVMDCLSLENASAQKKLRLISTDPIISNIVLLAAMATVWTEIQTRGDLDD